MMVRQTRPLWVRSGHVQSRAHVRFCPWANTPPKRTLSARETLATFACGLEATWDDLVGRGPGCRSWNCVIFAIFSPSRIRAASRARPSACTSRSPRCHIRSSSWSRWSAPCCSSAALRTSSSPPPAACSNHIASAS